MFGLEFLTIPIFLGIITLTVAAARLFYVYFFSPNAKWQVLHDWLTRTAAREESEQARQESEESMIETRPVLTGPELVGALNRHFRARWRRWRSVRRS